MKQRLKAIGGEYRLGFFHIYLDTYLSPESILSTDGMSTIVHEYIHFLQDVSTTYGLISIMKVVNEISHFYHEPKQQLVRIPYKLSSPIVQTNRDLFAVYNNDPEYLELPRRSVQFERLILEPGMVPGYPEVNAYRASVSQQGASLTFPFGALAIMEGMASLLEGHLYPTLKVSYEIPYDLPFFVAQGIHPDFAKNVGNVFALCDASLFYYHPTEAFVTCLQLMKSESWLPKAYSDVYQYVWSTARPPSGTTIELMEATFRDAVSHVHGMVNISAYSYARDWLESVLDHFLSMRRDRIDFLADLFASPSDKARHDLQTILRSTGTPLIFNSRFETFLLDIHGSVLDRSRAHELFYWVALGRLYEQILKSGELSCSLMDFCPLRQPICASAPWERVLPDQICLFNQIYRSLGLAGRQLETT